MILITWNVQWCRGVDGRVDPARIVAEQGLVQVSDSGAIEQIILEVLAANGVETVIQADDGFTPTPAISRAILAYNRDHGARRADGVVVTPSHNPPADGGFKYNPPHGGPADAEVTRWIEERGIEGAGEVRYNFGELAHGETRGFYIQDGQEGVDRGGVRFLHRTDVRDSFTGMADVAALTGAMVPMSFSDHGR